MKKSADSYSPVLTPVTYIIPLLLVAFISVFFAVSSIYHSRKIESTNFLSTLRSLTDEAKLELQIDIVKSFDAATTLSQNEALIRWFSGRGSETERELALAELSNLMEDNRYDQAFAASAIQQVYYLGNGQREPLSENDPDDTWFFEAMEMHTLIDINIDNNNDIGHTLLWVNAKVIDGETLLGMAGLGMNIERIQKELADLIPGESGAILFADEIGRVRLSYPMEMNNKNLSEILNNKSTKYIDLDGRKIQSFKRGETVYTVSYLPDLNLNMVYMAPTEDFLSPVFSLTRLYSILSIALIFLLIIVFLIVFQRLRSTIIYQNKSQDMTIHSMSMLAELKDNETGAHIIRTRKYCRILSEELSRDSKYSKYLTPAYIADLERSAPLHDVGKVGIPDSILQKPGKLTVQEFEIIKTHTVMGANVLEDAIRNYEFQSYLTIGVQLVRHHHEKWDGTGYPDGLKGENIPLSARIMAIADVYDALRSVRPYKDAISHEKSLSIIKEGSGTHFEPDLVEAFLRREKEFELISLDYSDN